MNFSCDQCGRRYSIADEKVQGRQFRVVCKACGHTIVVRAGGAPAVTPAPAAPLLTPAPAVTSAPRAPAPAVRVPAPPPSRPPPPPPRAAPPAAPPPPPSPDEELDDLFAAAAPPEPPGLDDPFAGAEPPAPPPAAPAMSEAELAWLSSGPTAPPADPLAAAGVADETGDDAADAEPSAPPPAGRRRLVVLAGGAVALAAVAAVAGFLVVRKPAPPPRRPPVAAAPAPKAAEPAPAPAVEPPPPAPAEPQAAAPAPAEPASPPVKSPRVQRGETRDRRPVRIASKDRKLLDLLDKKGDAAPAAPVQVATLDTGKSALDPGRVQQTISDNHGAFAACITKAVKAEPKLKIADRRATLMLTIKPDGVVAGAWIAEADLEKSRLGRCLVAAARRVVFPAFQGETIDVAAPLALSAVR